MRKRIIPQLIALIGLALILAHRAGFTERLSELGGYTLLGLAFAGVLAVVLTRAARGWSSSDQVHRIDPR